MFDELLLILKFLYNKQYLYDYYETNKLLKFSSSASMQSILKYDLFEPFILKS